MSDASMENIYKAFELNPMVKAVIEGVFPLPSSYEDAKKLKTKRLVEILKKECNILTKKEGTGELIFFSLDENDQVVEKSLHEVINYLSCLTLPRDYDGKQICMREMIEKFKKTQL